MNTSPAHPDSPARRISVYIDPGCPWTWVTAQWLREAAPHRNLDLRWRPLSLRLRDGDRPPSGAPAEIQALAVAARIQSHRLLRIFEALRAATRDHDIDRLYRRWGERVFAPPWPPAAPSHPDLDRAQAIIDAASRGDYAPVPAPPPTTSWWKRRCRRALASRSRQGRPGVGAAGVHGVLRRHLPPRRLLRLRGKARAIRARTRQRQPPPTGSGRTLTTAAWAGRRPSPPRPEHHHVRRPP